MRIFFRCFIILALAFGLTACNKSLDSSQLPAHISTGETYYTQFVVRYEKNAHLTTNFRRGSSISVNTPVSIMEISKKTIVFKINETGQTITVKNAKKHTGDNIHQAFDKLFSNQKVNLSQFNKLERKNIKNGTVNKGMRKAAVLVAIGYPPITKTPTLEADTWVYWHSRFNTFHVNFKNDKVNKIVD